MGLGKTLQTLSLLAYLKEHASDDDPGLPHLIICPLSVLSAWKAEIKRWTNLSVCTLHGPAHERARLTKSLISLGGPPTVTSEPSSPRFDIVLTTYDAYKAEQGWFKYSSRTWNYVVLDEGHSIKNSDTQLAHALQPIRAFHRLILTGTAVQNDLVELWSLFHWLEPKVFTDHTRFRFSSAFNLTEGTYDTEVLESCSRLIKLLMLRRTKDGVGSQISVPAREEITRE